MRSFKSWFAGRRMGSTESLESKPSIQPQLFPHRPDVKSQFELTSIQIRQLLERKQYQKVVEILRELPHSYILRCLESFPFKTLNNSVPKSFPIWETLLTKLHNSEEGYIPQFPYAACDELVVQIAWQLQLCNASVPAVYRDLFPSCKRVLKKVYMQYNEVLEQLYKEHEKVDHSLYTLGLHLPLGSDQSAVTLHQAVLEEVNTCLVDYRDAIERLEELSQNEVVSITDMLLENQSDLQQSVPTNGCDSLPHDFPLAPNPSQLQIQERLYFNQCVLTTLQPNRRRGNLSELLELLKERIRGDKEVLVFFARIRKWNETITDSESVEPWLRRYQHGVDCAIALLKEIEKELEITLPRADSPPDIGETHVSTSSEEGPLIVPVIRSSSLDEERPTFIQPRRHSAAVLDEYLLEEEDRKGEDPEFREKLPLPAQQKRRSRSVSPHKILRTGYSGIPVSGSCKSFDSASGSNHSLMSNTSGSVHDIHSVRIENRPVLAFTRVRSNQHSVVAGKKKSTFGFFPSSLTNLSTSNGNVSRSRSKRLFRSGSGGLVPWDRQNGEAMSANEFMLQQEVEYKRRELLHAREMIHELRKRERELTDRLSEQAQRHLQDSEKFEDILMGMSRPTMVVQRYQELYSQGRVEALDAIEGAEGVVSGVVWEIGGSGHGRRNFGMQLVLDVLKFAYCASCAALERLNREWRRSLGVNGIQDEVAVKQLESAVGLYLRRVSTTHDIATIIKETEQQILEKYSLCLAYSELKKLQPFCTYLEECVRVAWDLSVQTPPMVISCSESEFNCDLHTRFFNANKDSTDIALYLWPTLLQSSSRQILFRGVVLT